MIPVTPIEGQRILVNADLIEEVESILDTIIVLANGRRLLVTDTPTEIVDRIRNVRASVLAYADDILESRPGVVVPFPAEARA